MRALKGNSLLFLEFGLSMKMVGHHWYLKCGWPNEGHGSFAIDDELLVDKAL